MLQFFGAIALAVLKFQYDFDIPEVRLILGKNRSNDAITKDLSLIKVDIEEYRDIKTKRSFDQGIEFASPEEGLCRKTESPHCGRSASRLRLDIRGQEFHSPG